MNFEREERRKLIQSAIAKNKEEDNKEEYKWVVDYIKHEVIQVPVSNVGQKKSQQRKYR